MTAVGYEPSHVTIEQVTMNWRLVLWGGLGSAAVFVIIGAAWILTLPPSPSARAMAPIAK
jgi:hypothetical protein